MKQMLVTLFYSNQPGLAKNNLHSALKWKKSLPLCSKKQPSKSVLVQNYQKDIVVRKDNVANHLFFLYRIH